MSALQAPLFGYNQQLSVESCSADSGTGSLSTDPHNYIQRRSLTISEVSDGDNVFNERAEGDGELEGAVGGAGVGNPSSASKRSPQPQQAAPLKPRPLMPFPVTPSQTNPEPAGAEAMPLDPSSPAHDPEDQQMTMYHLDKHSPAKAEHANKNGYVRMGDNGVVAVFPRTNALPLPKLTEEEEDSSAQTKTPFVKWSKSWR